LRISKKDLIILAIVILVLVGGYFTFNKLMDNGINNYKNRIGVSLPDKSKILKSLDDHGGFHGDGEAYSEIQLTKEGAEKFTRDAKETGKWKALPTSVQIDIIIYGGKYEGTTYSNGKLARNIPRNIKNGIYFVRDRFAEKYPEQKATSINSRSAYNITIAILDSDTNKLYIYDLDT